MTERYRSQRGTHRTILFLCLALAALALAGVSCRQVSDVASNVSVLRGGELQPCIDACNATAAKYVKANTTAHYCALYLCFGNQGCISRENARFDGVLAQIEVQRQKCIQDCQHQGGATAGR